MAEMNVEPAAVTIPSAYLEDVRCALAEQINVEIDLEQDGSTMGHLRHDLQLLSDQLLDAADDLKVTAEPDTISAMLRATMIVLNGRIREACESAPFPAEDVVELADRLRWAAVEEIVCSHSLAELLASERRQAMADRAGE